MSAPTAAADPRAHPFPDTLAAICAGQHLSRAQTHALFAQVVEGALGDIELSALLTALKAKGEQPSELAGAAAALRAAALPFERPNYLYADSCGTGGDGAHTVNISTAVAFVAAEAGVPIAKHGNRSVSSQCGSADVLEKLGSRSRPARHARGRRWTKWAYVSCSRRRITRVYAMPCPCGAPSRHAPS